METTTPTRLRQGYAGQASKRTFIGQVVSVAMTKTIIVRVDAMKLHAKYGKSYKVSNKYPVHDEKGEAKMGDTVKFVESRPISKTKKWRLVEILQSPTGEVPLAAGENS